jgi:hypothetical protein
MAQSGFEPTYVRAQDPFADLSVEATLIDPQYALPSELKILADELAASESKPVPPPAGTRVKQRTEMPPSTATMIGELLPPNMDVLMTAHLPVSLSIEDIAGDELGDARFVTPQRSVHLSRVAIADDSESSDPLVRPVADHDDSDEPITVNAFIEHRLPSTVKPPPKTRVKNKNTAQMRPARQMVVIEDRMPELDPTLPPLHARSPQSLDRAAGFAPISIPDEITKTSMGALPRVAESTECEVASEEPAPVASFEDVLERLRSPRPRHEVAPQRYIPTVITSQPRIGITPENTSIAAVEDEDAPDAASGFADGRRLISAIEAPGAEELPSDEADALTKPPRLVSPYIVVGLGVAGALAALIQALHAPL